MFELLFNPSTERYMVYNAKEDYAFLEYSDANLAKLSATRNDPFVYHRYIFLDSAKNSKDLRTDFELSWIRQNFPEYFI